MSTEPQDEPLVAFLPAIRQFVPVGAYEPESTDACAACGDIECGDIECGGACPAALYVVRQVVEAFDSEDDREWWRDYFADEGHDLPSPAARAGTDEQEA